MTARRDLGWAAAFAGVALLLYARGLNGGYFGDDFLFVRWPPRLDVAAALFQRNPLSGWYRPLEALVLQLVQTRVGLATWPIHLLAIALHTTLAWLTLRAVRRLGGGTRAAALAGTACLVSQGAAMAVASNDTLSFLFGTLAGAIAAFVLLPPAVTSTDAGTPGVTDAAQPLPRFATLGVWLAYGVALLGKETSVGWLPVLLGLLAWRGWKGSRGRPVVAALGLCAITALYLMARAGTGATPPRFGPGRYQLGLGTNVLENIGLLAGALLSPVAPEQLFRPGPALVPAVAAAAGALLLVGLAFYALRMRTLRARVLGAVIGGALVLLPVLPLNRVSELYGYAALPSLAIALGFAGARVLTGRGRGAWAAAFVLLAAAHVAAIEHKLGLLAVNGTRATALLTRLRPEVARVGTNGTLWLVSPEDPRGSYSVFRMPGFHVLDYSEDFLRAYWERPDLSVRLTDEPEESPAPVAGDVVVRWDSPAFAAF